MLELERPQKSEKFLVCNHMIIHICRGLLLLPKHFLKFVHKFLSYHGQTNQHTTTNA